MSKEIVEKLKNSIRDVVDFPKPGIVFKDISPLLESHEHFNACIDLFASHCAEKGIERLAAIDARGFLFAGALALKLGIGLTLIRKKGKLPYRTVEASYDLEYGSNVIQMHVDAVLPNQKVAIVDDVLATGGTLKAACELVEKVGGKVTTAVCLIELSFLNGRQRVSPVEVYAPIVF